MIQFSFFSLLEIIKMKILKNPLWKKVKLIMISFKKIILNLIGTWQEKPLVKWNGKKDRFEISYQITLHWGDNDVGDIVMLVTLWWWLIWDDGGRIIMLVTFFVVLVIFSMYQIGHQHPASVTNISNLSPTHLVSNIRH